MLSDQVDLDHLFDDPPFQDFCDLFGGDVVVEAEQEEAQPFFNDSSSPDDDFLERIRDIENMLMEGLGDGDDDGAQDDGVNHGQTFPQPPYSAEEGASPKETSGNCSNSGGEEEVRKDDPVSKTQIRKIRNRDAAVRSRERKKEYVKDLEMKSRYMEAECRRLGRLLQCCYAENHMLRLSLHSMSMAKAESAVLLPESLLLGSLLWSLVMVCLLPPPWLSHELVVQTRLLPVVAQANLDGDLARVVALPTPKGKGGSKLIQLRAWVLILSKGCRASRTRMKMMPSATIESYG